MGLSCGILLRMFAEWNSIGQALNGTCRIDSIFKFEFPVVCSAGCIQILMRTHTCIGILINLGKGGKREN